MGTTVEDPITAMANVVEGEYVRAIVPLYYAHHPPGYIARVFSNMAEARIHGHRVPSLLWSFPWLMLRYI